MRPCSGILTCGGTVLRSTSLTIARSNLPPLRRQRYSAASPSPNSGAAASSGAAALGAPSAGAAAAPAPSLGACCSWWATMRAAQAAQAVQAQSKSAKSCRVLRGREEGRGDGQHVVRGPGWETAARCCAAALWPMPCAEQPRRPAPPRTLTAAHHGPQPRQWKVAAELPSMLRAFAGYRAAGAAASVLRRRADRCDWIGCEGL
jgi:hypothetical protein